MSFFVAFLQATWEIWVEAAPFVLLGFLVAGLARAFISTETVGKHLGKPGVMSVLKAALIGIPLPLCSCGVIPTALGLKRQGASRGATTAFLIATPETGVDSIAVTYALLDPLMTVFRPLAAMITAVTAGLLETWLPLGSAPPATTLSLTMAPERSWDEHAPLGSRIREGLSFAFGELLRDIGKWLLLGMVIAGLIAVLLPPGFLEQHLGGGLPAMLLMLVVGVPLYVCASASTPIAAALMIKGLSPGAALVFLLAGPATNAATIAAMANALGRRSLLIYLGSIAGCSLLLGLLLDQLYPLFGLSPTALVGIAGESFPRPFSVACAVIALGLFLWAFVPGKSHDHERCDCP